jgi:hypothetical protein
MGTYQVFPPEGSRSAACPPNLRWCGPLLALINIGDIDEAVERVKAGGGQILEGPLGKSGGNWIARCTDPQGAMFALEGKRRQDGIGYFERAASRDPSEGRFGLRR